MELRKTSGEEASKWEEDNRCSALGGEGQVERKEVGRM